MIKIFFDHQKFSTQKYGGISRYFANVINEIKTLPDYSYLLGVLYSPNHYITDKPTLFNNALANKVLASRYGSKAYRLNDWYCKRLLSQNEFDVFHPTYYDPYFVGRLKKPLVTTVHDMTHERLPEYFWAEDSLTSNKRINIERADKIIAISETTKKDLINYSNVDESKIEVIYHGMDLDAPLVSKPVANLPENYLLFVGDRSGYKNFFVFVNAFKQLSDKYPDLNVILTGGGKLMIAELEYINHLKLANRFTHVNVTDEELNYLYEKALVFVYPSLHEGFGLPILEAYRAGCPIILSDTDCFREIGADTVCYFSAREADDLAATIEKLANDSSLRQSLISKGAERLKDFPLGPSVNKTLDVYKSLT